MTSAAQHRIRVGPFVYDVHAGVPVAREGLATLYADFPRAGETAFVDFNVGIRPHRALWPRRRQADFCFDQRPTFAPVQSRHAFATLEWGINWCVSTHCNSFLNLHAGAVARNGQALVMPGVPGAGKSTLCALLGLSGWRVLTDENALITPGRAEVVPLYRPVSLKNASIERIRERFPDAVFGPPAHDTHKGTVTHLKADRHPDTFATEPLPVRALVFPEYASGRPQRLSRADKAHSFLIAAYHSFNYSLLGEAGFHAMRALVDSLPCYTLCYHDMDWALRAFDLIADGGRPP